jgi:glycosyltransferase involved in cell wall biosynthesis
MTDRLSFPQPGGSSPARPVAMAAARLSVFLSNYNHERFLPQALDALLAQSVQPRQIYLIDDGSTDDSAAILTEYAARSSIIRLVIHEQNRGIYANMADFLAQASDDYLYFAAADDVVLPGFFERSLALLERYPQAGLCSALVRIIAEDGSDKGLFETALPSREAGFLPPESCAALLCRDESWIMGTTTIYRREALLAAGGFDPALLGYTDGFAGRVIAVTTGCCFIPEILASWRRLEDSISSHTSSSSVVLAVADRAIELMATAHRDRFPDGYARRWRRRWLFGAVSLRLQSGSREAWAEIATLFAPLGLVDRIALWLGQILPGGRQIAVLYAFLRLRPFDIITVFRRHLSYRLHRVCISSLSRSDTVRGGASR